MSDFVKSISSTVKETLNFHAEKARLDIENETHGLHMLIVDLMVWARDKGIDFPGEVSAAASTFADCYSDEDFN